MISVCCQAYSLNIYREREGMMVAKQMGKVLMALFFLFGIAVVSVHAETVFEEDFESGWGDWYADNGL